MRDLSELYSSVSIEKKESFDLSRASTFRIGGLAKLALFPKNEEELLKAIRISKENEVRFEIIGNGSNVLFADEGFDGAIIFTNKINNVTLDDCYITAQTGTKLVKISSLALENSLSGFEFAHGIPGTVGGAMIMNAGAYGSDMASVVVSSRYYDTKTYKIEVISREEHKFAYRDSLFACDRSLVFLSTTIRLQHADIYEIVEKISKNTESRRNSQPLEYPNCGSFFKRPDGYFAAKLIDDANLKGYSIGGAEVSTKHAGFIVNKGGATANDVLLLSKHIEDTVYQKHGVKLEREVKYIF